MLNQYLQVPTNVLKYHMYCTNCQVNVGVTTDSKLKTVCDCCLHELKMSSVGTFNMDVEDQLKKLLSEKIIFNNLRHRFQRSKIDPNALEDLYDGSVYQKYIND